MWPFQQKSTRNQLNDLRDELETLKREIRGLRLEWEDAYDKMRTLTARFVKRAQRIEESELAAATESATPGGSPTDLSRLDPISRRILERRQKMFPPKREGVQ